MKLIIVGAPGAGKGTQAKQISDNLQIPHISTGDIFRENIKNETELGNLAKSFMDKGELVPDQVTIDMLKERITKEDCKNGFLLDGFPRTILQAQELDKITEIEKVIDIEVPDSEIVERITGRRTGEDGTIYHIKYKPAPEGVKLTQRKDDTKDVVQERLKVYHEQTEPIIKHYEKENKVFKIDGTKPIEEVWSDIKKTISLEESVSK